MMADRIVKVRLVIDAAAYQAAIDEAHAYFRAHRSKRKRAAFLEAFRARIRSMVRVER
jgi:hypothetical protein